jgi:hypothetical protein
MTTLVGAEAPTWTTRFPVRLPPSPDSLKVRCPAVPIHVNVSNHYMRYGRILQGFFRFLPGLPPQLPITAFVGRESPHSARG